MAWESYGSYVGMEEWSQTGEGVGGKVSCDPQVPWCFPILWVSAFRSMAEGGLQFIGF